VIAAVRARLEADPPWGRGVLDRLAEATRGLRDELAAEAEDPGRVRALIGTGQRALEELGVVPEPAAALVRAIEAAGGAAKISGAGSLAGPGTGSLLAYHPEPEALAGVAELAAIRRLEVPLGVEGLRLAGPDRDPPAEAG
jgi:hypothetical protein